MPTRASSNKSCPSGSAWAGLVSGHVQGAEADRLLAHASDCHACAELLREMLNALEESSDPEEPSAIPSTADLAKRLAAKRQRSAFSYRLPIGIAASIVLIASVVWFWQRENVPPTSLLEQAYSEHRDLELRFPGAAYAPLRAERGPSQRLNAPSLLEAEARIARSGPSHPRDHQWLLARARAQILRWDPAAATATLEAALEGSPDSEELLSALAMSLFESGEASGNTEAFGKAAQTFSRVLQRDEKNQVARFNRAIVYEKLQMFQEAVADWEQFLRIEKQGGWAEEARQHLEADLKKLGRAGMSPSPAEPGDSVVTDALRAVFVNSVDRKRAALFALSDAFISQYGDRWLRDLLIGADHPKFLAALQLLDQALTSNLQGDPVRAAQGARLAESAFAQARNAAGVARSRYELLYALQRSSNASSCLEQGNRWAGQFQEAGYFWLHAQALLELASCSNMRSEFLNADRFAREALVEDDHHGFLAQRMRSVGIRAVGLRAMGRWQEAWRLDVEGLRAFWSGIFPAVRAYQFYEDMSIAAESIGDYAIAAALSREAVTQVARTDNRSLEAMARGELARRTMLAGNPRQAETEFSRCERTFEQLPPGEVTRLYRAESEIGIARAEARMGKTRSALARLQTVAPDLEGFDNQIFAAHYYRAVAEIRRTANDRELEAAAWRSLAKIAETGLGSLSAPRDRLVWTHELGDAFRGIVRCKLQAGKAEEALDTWLSYRTADFRTRRFGASVRELSKRLTRSTRVTYAQLEDGIAAWSYDNRGIVYRWLDIPPEVLNVLANRLSRDCANPSSSTDEIRETGRKLYQALIAPFASSWNAERMLILDVDGPAGQIPFEVIPLPNGGYLGERFSLEIGPGIDERRDSVSAEPLLDPSLVLLVGSPRAAGADASLFPPLADVVSEVESVSELFPRHLLLTKDAATPLAVTQALARATIFHFAGHAVNSSQHVGLLLAAEKSGGVAASGFLSATDLTPRELANCRLAVLSACSTAGMKKSGIAEPDSLARALLAAGIRQIVASRWPVDSRATRTLMIRFYSELKQGQPVVRALRIANQQLRDAPETRHPYYWSAFSVISDS